MERKVKTRLFIQHGGEASNFNNFIEAGYAMMIHEAMEALDEDGGSGSRVDSISSYTVSHYEDLPWAHEGILSTHLEKLVRSGDILTNSNGSCSCPKNMKTPQFAFGTSLSWCRCE
ncbi:hypothetical protein VNO80_12533 [Phaseolus coccineus]|uniref:Uncharacterized protein n=1 Tax=Phaseolus coccineus TaxID=3886 RepID=A0AAN9N1V9_PHACN